jgi:hypothetical protein
MNNNSDTYTMFKIHIVFTKILGDITMSAKLSKEF